MTRDDRPEMLQSVTLTFADGNEARAVAEAMRMFRGQ
jgi:hypothetical protein